MKTSALAAAVCLLLLSVPSVFALDLLLEDFSDGVIDDPDIILSGDAILGTRAGGEGGSALLRQLAGANGTGWGIGFTMDFEDVEVTDSDVLLVEYESFSDAATDSQELYKVSVIVNGEGELGDGALELINVSHNKLGTGQFVGTTWGQVAAGGNSANAKFAGLANWDTTDGVSPEELDEVYRVRAAFRIGTFEDELFTNVEHLLVNSTGLVDFADVGTVESSTGTIGRSASGSPAARSLSSMCSFSVPGSRRGASERAITDGRHLRGRETCSQPAMPRTAGDTIVLSESSHGVAGFSSQTSSISPQKTDSGSPRSVSVL
jgi:hypothetical protein